MSQQPLESFEVEGLTVKLWQDDDCEHANPREDDQLGTMVCWHPDYYLGDEQIRDGDGRGAVRNAFELESGSTDADVRSMRHLARYLTLVRKAVCVVPLYLYDHSGISMSAGTPNPFDNPIVGRDEFAQGLGWDTTMVGFIYTTAARVVKLCGEPIREGEQFYCPSDWTGSSHEWIARQLVEEVKQYSAYLQGRVYGYTIEDAEGEHHGGCWGFLADTTDEARGDDLHYVLAEAKEEAEGIAHGIREDAAREAAEAERWANADVATVQS